MKFLTGLVVMAMLAVPAHALTLGVTEGVTYRATDPEIEARFEPLAKALSAATRQPVQIKVISPYGRLREALQSGQLDLAFIHPAHIAFEAIKNQGYKALAWTQGYTDYKVSFLCKEPQAIQNWATVAGKSLVTPDPDSITAVMTRALLAEHRLKPTDVKLQTTRYQDAVPFYVEHGFALYGATAANSVIKTWQAQGGKLCATSRPLPIKQWVVAPKVDASTAQTLREALLNLEQNEPGRKALAASGYKGFAAPSPELEKQLILWLGL